MKKAILFLAVLMLASCAHQPLKTTKKAPCDFDDREISSGFEDNTK